MFIDFAKRIRELVLEFFQHQNYPLELVLAEAGSKYPEVSTAFNMLNLNRNEEIPLENQDSLHYDDIQNVKFDLEPYIAEYSNGIEIIVNYQKNLFKPAHIEYMMESFRNVIEFFSRHPLKRSSEYKEAQKKRSFRKR